MNGNNSSLKVGDKVTYSGFDFTVVEVCAWTSGMVCIRNARGTTCVSASDCKAV